MNRKFNSPLVTQALEAIRTAALYVIDLPPDLTANLGAQAWSAA